ncbi:hypothetical protein KSP39_PZI001648 [Platanthera zijinensis]|uniref:Uncharacterized protein n=1 Tax=Platanthera zijinensis TaxID=2320716 RepID=A0AAP0C1H6_9ASPA
MTRKVLPDLPERTQRKPPFFLATERDFAPGGEGNFCAYVETRVAISGVVKNFHDSESLFFRDLAAGASPTAAREFAVWRGSRGVASVFTRRNVALVYILDEDEDEASDPE